jgi:uncharacterized protein with PIN domain
MNLAWFRFYEELNEFLPRGKRKQISSYTFSGAPSVKDAIEAQGIPHVEVDLILVNGISVDFSYKLRNEDSVSVYPVFESFDITPVTHLREKPLRDLKFVLDVHLGKLARYLRLTGFDTLYKNGYDDKDIIQISLEDERIILTHDLELLKNKLVTRGYWIRSQYPDEQLKEILQRFDAKNSLMLFKRCMECNTLLRDISKKDIIERLPLRTREYFHEFKNCPGCNRIYWKGSHYERMKKYIDSVINDVN